MITRDGPGNILAFHRLLLAVPSGLALVVAGTWNSGLEGIAITSAAFAQVSPWFPWLLAVVVFLFAYSTLVAWGFYGLQAWGYLFGHGTRAQWTYKILYVVALPPAAAISGDSTRRVQ